MDQISICLDRLWDRRKVAHYCRPTLTLATPPPSVDTQVAAAGLKLFSKKYLLATILLSTVHFSLLFA
jgi:hypothetical protein